MYSERGKFAVSLYNKNSLLMFFPKESIFRERGRALIHDTAVYFLIFDLQFTQVTKYSEDKKFHDN